MNKKTFKFFIKIIMLFLITSFVVDKLVYLSITKIEEKVFSGGVVGKVNHYLSLKDTTDLIIFGSSRANHHFNTLNGVEFNMGMDGKRIAFHATLIKLLPKNYKQTVILQLDPEYFFSENYDGSDIKSLKNLFHRSKIINKQIKKLNQDELISNFYYTNLYNFKLVSIFKNYLFPKYDYKNYSGFDPIYPNDFQKSVFKKILDKKGTKTDCQANFKINKIYDIYIDEIISFCKENNKKLIVFTSPKYYDNCKEDNLLLTKIMNQKNINYYDFTNFFNDNNDINYWKDLTHLSYVGAELFTKGFKKSVN
jgi:hypothetical protein